MRSETEVRFVDMYRRHEPDIRRYCRRRLNPDEVDDATLEVFAIAWRRSDGIPFPEPILPWLYSIARNVVRNHHRSSARLNRLKRKVGALVGAPEPTPETWVIRSSEDSLILDALSSLRPNDQEILRLRTWEDLTRGEAAAVLNISLEAVDMRTNRALKRMERALLARGHRFTEERTGRRRKTSE